jgi:hypothetical protein
MNLVFLTMRTIKAFAGQRSFFAEGKAFGRLAW